MKLPKKKLSCEEIKELNKKRERGRESDRGREGRRERDRKYDSRIHYPEYVICLKLRHIYRLYIVST